MNLPIQAERRIPSGYISRNIPGNINQANAEDENAKTYFREGKMQILLTLSEQELETLAEVRAIRDEHDVRYCVHELIRRSNISQRDNISLAHEKRA